MGGADMFSTSLIVPIMGHWYDSFRAHAITGGANAAAAHAIAGSNTFLKVAIMPAILLVVFTLIYFSRRTFYKNHHDNKAAAKGASEAIA
jgi:heme/copper-type cytochrome/quinol oxidase subunit 2